MVMLLASAMVTFLLPLGLQSADPRDSWYEDVLSLYYNGEYEQTIEVLSALDLDNLTEGQQLECYKYRAFSYIALGDTENARGDLKSLLAIDPSHRFDPEMVSPKLVEQLGSARGELVKELFEQGKAAYYDDDYDSAIRLMDRILRLDSEYELALEYRQLSVERADLTARLEPEGARGEEEAEVDPNQIYQLSSDITAPVLIDRVTPRYPTVDARLGREGQVIILVVVEKDGSVSSTKVLRSVSNSIDTAAVAAVEKWLYRPASLNGRPVRVSLVVGIDFTIREQ
jgi:protein TonB